MTTETLAAPATPPAPLSIAELGEHARALRTQVARAFIGQAEVFDQVLLALLAAGHVLIEGVPGLGKTLLVRALAASVGCSFGRVQFTPDLMPADVTGHAIYDPKTERFQIRRGPVFANLLLADEINRAPAKTQAALLESMQEGQVTIEGRRFALPAPFMVVATQNPIEQEGTYPLPEAQLDRFLLHVRVGYPNAAAEAAILKFARERARQAMTHAPASAQRLTQAQVFAARGEVLDLHLAPQLEEYIVQLVLATRDPSAYGAELARYVAFGASPRGTIALDRCTRAHAWLNGRDYATPEDVHAIAADVLRHRVLLSYEAEAEGVDADKVIALLLERVPLP